MQRLTGIIGLLLVLGAGAVPAQEPGNDSADVWAVIEQQWDADEKDDKRWIDRMLTDDFVGWGKEAPAPRTKTSTRMWDKFNEQRGKTIAHELYPLSIVVRGDVAIAHYLYTTAFQDTGGEIEMSNGRYTDVLVRTEDGWKFIAWHGGDD